MPDRIVPDWPAPNSVRAAMTTRHTDLAALDLPGEPAWLKQVHGTTVVRAAPGLPEADASFTTERGVVCVAKSADCLPVLFCDDAGLVVAAAHAGWRGLAAGVLEATVRALPVRPDLLMAWFGAAIGPQSFEVGPEVRAAFMAHDANASVHFKPRHARVGPRHARESGHPEKYLADLYGLARQRLGGVGVTRTFGGGLDTFADRERFYSYRREGSTGRMAALIWLER